MQFVGCVLPKPKAYTSLIKYAYFPNELLDIFECTSLYMILLCLDIFVQSCVLPITKFVYFLNLLICTSRPCVLFTS
jgi:hypothetical protein